MALSSHEVTESQRVNINADLVIFAFFAALRENFFSSRQAQRARRIDIMVRLQ